MLNVGYVGGTNEGVEVRVYYDTTFTPVGDTQPLVNGPRGFCLDLTNTGRVSRVDVGLPDGTTTTITLGTGNPVTGGPASGRSRTAAQMASLGFRTRGDLANATGPT